MKILQLAPQIPLPLSDGGKVGIFNITKSLAERGHSITLACFDRGEATDLTPLRKHCTLIGIRHSTQNSAAGMVRNIASNLPYNISKYYSDEMKQQVEKILKTGHFDIIHIDHLHMAHYGIYGRKLTGLPIVLREHNIESSILERYRDHTSNPFLKGYLNIQVKRIQNYETRMASLFNCCAVITPDDERKLKAMQPDAKTSVVPGGVESRYFLDEEAHMPVANSLVFFGGFDWLPNQDALRWFLRTVMPKLSKSFPKSVLTIVGKNVPGDLLSYASEQVVFKGFVEDLKSEIQKSSVVVVPIRIGGGIRLKILESFAMKVPVVSTSVGCEGIECLHGRDILIADTPEDFVLQIKKLFDDQGYQRSIADNAYALAKEKYSWEVVAEQLEKIYIECIKHNEYAH